MCVQPNDSRICRGRNQKQRAKGTSQRAGLAPRSRSLTHYVNSVRTRAERDGLGIGGWCPNQSGIGQVTQQKS